MVSGDGAGPRAESDFLDFAGAHEAPALRAATVVCGDPSTAERVLREALASVAGDWSEARETGPAAALRAALYPRALAACGPDADARRADPPAGGPTAPWAGGTDLLAEQRTDVLAVLATLAPPRRAVAALRWLDERPDAEIADLTRLDAAGLRDTVDEVRRRLGPLVHGEDAAVQASDDEVRDLLELATDDLDDPALAEAAWEDALRRRRAVRRRVLVVGAVALAGGGAAVALGGREPASTAAPRPATTSSAAVAGRLRAVPVDGIDVLLAPEPALEPRLPAYPEAPRLALPGRLGPGAGRPLGILSPAGSTASVRAVFLVRVAEDRVQPALFLPRQSSELQLVAMAPLRPTVDAGGNTGLSLGPRAVDSERRRVVFAQPGAVVVLEVRSARTFRLPVEDDNLSTAGWATDGRTIVAGNGSSGWLVDSVTGDTTRTVSAVNAGWADIGTSGGPPTLRAFAGNGRLTNLRSLDGPDVDVYGESVSNTEGWACRTVFFGSVRSTGNRVQGLMAAQGDLRPVPRILAAAATEEVPLAAYRPLAWGPRDVVLFESRSFVAERESLRVLAWDVIENRLYRVSEVDQPAADSATDQAFTGVWCL
jgi:DNA-directed RNA polymerase specialized sigma24 family protein